MPRMCPSPSPRIWLDSPLSISTWSVHGRSASMITLSFSSCWSPNASGQKWLGKVPFGENMTMKRLRPFPSFPTGPAAKLLMPPRKGKAAAERPRSRTKSRRV